MIGYAEIEIFDAGQRLPRDGGWADIGNLRAAEQYRRRGVASWLLGQAAGWLRLRKARPASLVSPVHEASEEAAMELTVLAVPDCPNLTLLEQRLAQVTEGRRDLTITRQVITDQDQAARWQMHGSPTLLVDGTDPFAEPEEPASLSCRLYRDGNGQVDGAPSASQLRQAIGEPAATAADAAPD